MFSAPLSRALLCACAWRGLGQRAQARLAPRYLGTRGDHRPGSPLRHSFAAKGCGHSPCPCWRPAEPGRACRRGTVSPVRGGGGARQGACAAPRGPRVQLGLWAGVPRTVGGTG